GFEKLVAVKTIRPDVAGNSDFQELFLQEARNAALLNHPNCVQIFDVGLENATFFIAMEFIDGIALGTLLSRKNVEHKPRIPVGVAARITMDAAAGLDFAHRAT